MDHRYESNNTHHSKFKTYFTASQYFLQRNFEDCRKYALKAIEINPNNIIPSQILAIAKILLLSNEDPNYYSILDLPLYTQDQQLIKTNFKNATNLLNPNKNGYPFASEAFQVVLQAWSVLSNPTQKTRFDNGLKMKTKEKVGTFTSNSKTFWSVCPYCYYVYEFLKDYEDCLLRCQNDKCKRGFHALPIVGPPPPPEVAAKGEYYCFGFSVLGIEGKSLWSPFVYKNDEDEFNVDEFIDIFDDEGEKDENGKKKESLGVEKEFVITNGGEVNMEGNKKFEISDDEAQKDENGRKEKSLGVEEEFVKTNGGEVDEGKKKRIKMVEAEEDENGKRERSLGVEKEFMKTNGGEVDKGKKKRIKMMAKCTKKVLGKGNKVNMNEVVYSKVEGNDDDFEFGNNVGGKINENNNVEFFCGR
ncbi:hypothetical protein RND71_014892 [Anisodus tanguticus]|uniref:J domain-containing protein n=1 Tax=Anisodus tanguticus TaxID=243964 RepID=A0AAE1VFF4_9SOLA|nr:hypothetical protein RND71_014892 [Anisodus tanguticus]